MKDRLQDISANLTTVQCSRLLSADPHDISRYHYAPFEGASLGLFQVAPGWERMELSPLGLRVRAILEEQQR